MAFKRYSGKIGSASPDSVRIDGKGRAYIPSCHSLNGSYELLWDADTNRIGLHPQKVGTRKFTDAKGGVIVSFKSLLDDFQIPYPQLCNTAWDGEIFTLSVSKAQITEPGGE